MKTPTSRFRHVAVALLIVLCALLLLYAILWREADQEMQPLPREKPRKTDVSAEQIRKALETHDSAVKTLYLECTLYVEVASFKIDPRSFPTTQTRIVYARNGEKEYFKYSNFDVGEKEASLVEELSWDGATERVYGSKPGKWASVSQEYESLKSFLVPDNTARLGFFGSSLIKHLGTDDVSVLLEQEEVHGALCYVLSGKDPKVGIYRLWLDKNLGFLARRIQYWWRNSEAHGTILLRDFEEIDNGLWFPRRIEQAYRGENTPELRNLYLVEKVSINEPISEDIFHIAIPADVPIERTEM